jgi:hypothetical protein
LNTREKELAQREKTLLERENLIDEQYLRVMRLRKSLVDRDSELLKKSEIKDTMIEGGEVEPMEPVEEDFKTLDTEEIGKEIGLGEEEVGAKIHVEEEQKEPHVEEKPSEEVPVDEPVSPTVETPLVEPPEESSYPQEIPVEEPAQVTTHPEELPPEEPTDVTSPSEITPPEEHEGEKVPGEEIDSTVDDVSESEPPPPEEVTSTDSSMAEEKAAETIDEDVPCPQCATPVSKSSSICYYCGAELKEKVEEEEIKSPAEVGKTEEDGTPKCQLCNEHLTFIEQYGRWYCYTCEKYGPKDL